MSLSTCTIENDTSIMSINVTDYTSVVKQASLPGSSNENQRIISFKALPDSDSNAYAQIAAFSPGDSINGSGSNSLFQSFAIEVQASVAGAASPNIPSGWAILKRYPDLLSGYGVSNITNATAVSVPTNQSLLFVNLLNESKALVLPAIGSINPDSKTCLTYTIKDVHGNAAISSMYLSTSGGATIDSNNTILKIDDDYACIDLVSNSQLNQWMITGYYGQI